MIRTAQSSDIDDIFELIHALADYERLAHEAVLDKKTLARNLFGPRPYAEVLIAEEDSSGEVVGYALFFHNFSTFLGKPGIYLEDLFIKPQHRGKGHGKALLAALARLAIERGCGRLEWWVLDWNKPAIEFYQSIGAVAMSDWTVHRLSGQALDNLAGVTTA